ncbi:cytochrome P450 [Tanacetum coccineum]
MLLKKSKKHTLWNRLSQLILGFHAMVMVLGDFNEVRSESERMRSSFCKTGYRLFNDFIINNNLVDLLMGGRDFTRMNKYGTKLSKLDRILVSPHFTSKWPNANLLALPRELSDHCPLVLKSHSMDYGPIPFKLFNSWLLDSDFPAIVSRSWSSPIESLNPTVNIHPTTLVKKKLQFLKCNIKIWRNSVSLKNGTLIRNLKSKVELLDLKADTCGLSTVEVEALQEIVKMLTVISRRI